jgi:hypothetical protein
MTPETVAPSNREATEASRNRRLSRKQIPILIPSPTPILDPTLILNPNPSRVRSLRFRAAIVVVATAFGRNRRLSRKQILIPSPTPILDPILIRYLFPNPNPFLLPARQSVDPPAQAVH